MTKKFKVVGVSGLSGAGKDLFYELCSKELEKKNAITCRIGLADELKRECRKALKSMYNIDPVSCPREEKKQNKKTPCISRTFKKRRKQRTILDIKSRQ